MRLVDPLHPTLEPDLCTACGACEVACVEARYGLSGLQPDDVVVLERRRLAIRPTGTSGDGVRPALPSLDVCTHCPDSPCVTVCPHHALLRFPSGRVELLEERCTGCGKCVSACPYRAIRRVNDLDLAVKCDGCRPLGHAPACAPACPTGALRIAGTARAPDT
jgi:phenylglyoxylate dehydrogenase beta subunit